MERREVKVADLAKLWDVSVNTTWKRIKREGLSTINKIDNNREITFVIVDKTIIGKYQAHNDVNHLDEGLLIGEVLPKSNQDNEFVKDVMNRLLTADDKRNEQLGKYFDELITYKSQALFLEDKQKSQEALYLNEINNLSKDKNILMKVSTTVIIIMSMLMITLLSLYINKLQNPTIVEKTVVKTVVKQAPVKTVKKSRRR